jgi:HlyD family secretion protein
MEIGPMKKLSLLLAFLIFACNPNDQKELYSGRMEVETIRITAKSSGELDSMVVNEGEAIRKGQLLAIIDTEKLQLQKQLQQAQYDEIVAQHVSVKAQIKQLEVQKALVSKNLDKARRMLSKGAMTEQSTDALQAESDVLAARLEALKTQFTVIESKKTQLLASIEITDLAISDARIASPIDGIILTKFRNQHEIANPGLALFDLADLSEMKATIYVPGEVLPAIGLDQKAHVHVDGLDNNLTGSVRWISQESEFTPKTILTKETRTTLVYAVEISVPNPDGVLKIGMPVDVSFEN